jgi:hypothetical protein
LRAGRNLRAAFRAEIRGGHRSFPGNRAKRSKRLLSTLTATLETCLKPTRSLP